MNLIERILAIREGGQTQRCHTIPHLGEYSVASHSYNALNLLLLLYPGDPRVELIKAVQWHDVPERWTGDIPAPAKWASKELKGVLDTIEQQVLEKLGILDTFQELTEGELNWLSGVDLLELWLWSKEQIYLGNKNMVDMERRVHRLFEERDSKTPQEIKDFLGSFWIECGDWKRTVECNDLIQEE